MARTIPIAPLSSAAAPACLTRAWADHATELQRWLRHQLGDDATADDILQDVFIKALQQGSGFCRIDQPRAWLYQVARHALIDRARRTRPTEPLERHAPALVAPVPEPPEPVQALTGCLSRVLAELSADDASILRACDLDGQDQRDYAQAHALTLSATKARLRRARLRLRERLTEVCRVRFDSAGHVSGHDGRSTDP